MQTGKCQQARQSQHDGEKIQGMPRILDEGFKTPRPLAVLNFIRNLKNKKQGYKRIKPINQFGNITTRSQEGLKVNQDHID